MNRILKLALGLAAAAALGGHAQAATWVLDYTATNGGAPGEANLTLETASAVDAAGGYDVTSITGEVDGETITGLIANPSQPFPAYSADGMFIFDNVFYADSSPVLSNPGLFFSGASGDEYNLFSDNATTYELYRATSGVGYQANSVGVLAYRDPPSLPDVGGIPEPAAWSLMILGFGGVGALLRRRRNAIGATLA
ncbi:PEPxxWA-CTERM sorting domain-containing protein [Phenylobacterium sp.]|uniref:PEPxxWA-CTERM sorting domain-containing protein n=1 Tax=Phenylobacterium sp. TaxID=1871053 RepID=UPI0012211D20|nr:PEPxxWA-CTERM sorting domain-containing protein [Phenylobacterium sp.]THD53563.1 MAG: PEP-CTERM sorting domain-containing protein [Phenylobacterium sp.]